MATRTMVWKLLVVALGADVARVDAVLGQRRRHGRVLDQQLVAVVVEVADRAARRRPGRRACAGSPARPRAAASLLTVTRTSSEPAWASAATWSAVASASAVSVLVIDWTTTGWPEPTGTPPTSTVTLRRPRRAVDGQSSAAARMPVSNRVSQTSKRHQDDETGRGRRRARRRRRCACRLTRWMIATRHGRRRAAGSGSALTTARFADSNPISQTRKTGGSCSRTDADGADDAHRPGHLRVGDVGDQATEATQDQRRRVNRSREALADCRQQVVRRVLLADAQLDVMPSAPWSAVGTGAGSTDDVATRRRRRRARSG